MSEEVLGKAHDRLDGPWKVSGALRYSGDQQLANLAYGFLITGTVARGEIRTMDVSEAEKAPGVVAIYTPLNWRNRFRDRDGAFGGFAFRRSDRKVRQRQFC